MSQTRNVVLLRGVNLGARNKIAMSDLRKLLGGLGFEDVQTYVQSGNAVFTSGAGERPGDLTGRIEEAIAAETGLDIKVVVRTADEMRAAIDGNPLPVREPANFLFAHFLAERPTKQRLAAVDPATFAPEEFAVGDRVIYVWCPNGMQKAKLTQTFWERRLGVVVTARNWNTVTRLVEMAAG
jgi:uncharacterized protein (DUF1697 family)